MRKTLLILVLLSGRALAQPALIPWPQAVEWREGRFPLAMVAVTEEPDLAGWSAPLREYLREIGALAPSFPAPGRTVSVERDTALACEAYALTIDPSRAVLAAGGAAGALHGLRTLQQLTARGGDGAAHWPCVRIADFPRYSWRGLMLDVSRHFYSADFVKRLLDEMARLKLNVLHWHLTDDQGWRVEVARYPRLTEVGAWRQDPGGQRCGGFYTQAEVREIVRYAHDRGIEVVPEIEFPGHCTAALAAYPHLGCRQDTLAVPSHWGVFQDVYCVGRETTWTCFEDVLTELLPLFPSPWVHIGGDEVPQDRWRACAACRQRKQAAGLPDEDALQAWAVRRVQEFLQGKGKRLIGWDEILAGGLDSTAVVEVWRGDEHARLARRNGNRMIRTLYFNTSPARLTLDDVLRYDPSVDGSCDLILGAECPVWSEHIDERNFGYLVFPRLQAFAERLWTGGAPRADLRERLVPEVARLEQAGWITASHDRDLFTAQVRHEPARGDWLVTAARGRPDLTVAFVAEDTAGSFTDSLRVARAGQLRLAPVWRGQRLQDERVYRIVAHLGLGAVQTLSEAPSGKYGLDPLRGMCDGLLGTDDFHDGLWQGWEGRDLTVALDLGQAQEIGELGLRCLQSVTYWILLPRSVAFESSLDAENWRPLATMTHKVPVEPGGQFVHDFRVRLAEPIVARHVRAVLSSCGPMPAWHLGAGGKSWIFTDEFVVRSLR